MSYSEKNIQFKIITDLTFFKSEVSVRFSALVLLHDYDIEPDD